MNRISRGRRLTAEEAAFYREIRRRIEQDLPDLLARRDDRAAYVQAVRDGLCLMGLPINDGWQPDDHTIRACHAMGVSVEELLAHYRPRVAVYEQHVRGKPDV